MSKKKKNGNQEKTLKIIVLVTALLNLIRAIVDLIQKFLEWERGDVSLPNSRRYNTLNVKFCQYDFKRRILNVRYNFRYRNYYSQFSYYNNRPKNMEK